MSRLACSPTIVILGLSGFLSCLVILEMTLSIQAHANKCLGSIVPQALQHLTRRHMALLWPFLVHPLARSSVSSHLLVLLASV